MYNVWGESDPASALRSATALPDDTRRAVLPGLCQNWAKKDPQAAWQYVVALEEGVLQDLDTVLSDIAANWVATDLNTALSWIDATVTDDKLYTEIMKRATMRLTRDDPAAAATLLDTIPGLYELQPHLLSASMHAWIQDDPEAAAAWAAEAQLDSVRAMAVKTVSAFWAREDFATAG